MLTTLERFEGMVAGLEARGFTPTEIARGAGVGRTTIHRIRHGESKAPQLETFERIKSFCESVAVPPMEQK